MLVPDQESRRIVSLSLNAHRHDWRGQQLHYELELQDTPGLIDMVEIRVRHILVTATSKGSMSISASVADG
jgi:hypothetical protein